MLLALVRTERTTGAEDAGAVVQPRDVAAEPRKPLGARRPPKAAACKPENFKIVLDVGHTPEAPGATSARGAKEFAFNLQLARRIQKALVGGGFLRTKLITAHGIGLVSHEAPRLTATGPVPYAPYDADRALENGMVISVETALLHPARGYIKLEDTLIVCEAGWEAPGDSCRKWNSSHSTQ